MCIRNETECKDKWYYYNILLFIHFFWVLKFKISSLRKTNHSWFSKSALNNSTLYTNYIYKKSIFTNLYYKERTVNPSLALFYWAYLLKTTQGDTILKLKKFRIPPHRTPVWMFFTSNRPDRIDLCDERQVTERNRIFVNFHKKKITMPTSVI